MNETAQAILVVVVPYGALSVFMWRIYRQEEARYQYFSWLRRELRLQRLQEELATLRARVYRKAFCR